MYEISVEGGFSAAHKLVGYDGNCARIHGHNWRVRVGIRASRLDDLGFVLDFRKVKTAMARVLKEFDHTLLNDHADFQSRNPSSENLAAYLHARLAPLVDDGRCTLWCVEVEEGHGVAARFTRE